MIMYEYSMAQPASDDCLFEPDLGLRRLREFGYENFRVHLARVLCPSLILPIPADFRIRNKCALRSLPHP